MMVVKPHLAAPICLRKSARPALTNKRSIFFYFVEERPFRSNKRKSFVYFSDFARFPSNPKL